RATNFLRRSDAVSYLHAAAGLAQSLDDAAAARNFGRDSRNCDPISPRPSRCKFRVSFPEKADVHRPRPLRVEERTFEMGAHHDRFTRAAVRGDPGDGGKGVLDRGHRTRRRGWGYGRGALRGVIADKGPDACFTAHPVGPATAVHVKIDEAGDDVGRLWPDALRESAPFDRLDDRPVQDDAAFDPAFGRKDRAFERCVRIGHEICSAVLPKSSTCSSGAWPLATSQQPINASPLGSRISWAAFRARCARSGATRPPAAYSAVASSEI